LTDEKPRHAAMRSLPGFLPEAAARILPGYLPEAPARSLPVFCRYPRLWLRGAKGYQQFMIRRIDNG